MRVTGAGAQRSGTGACAVRREQICARRVDSTNRARGSLEHVAQNRLRGVACRSAQLLLDRAPDLVARGRGEHAPRERARDLFADLTTRLAALAAEITQLEVGQVHALGLLGARMREEDLAARERELADREALGLTARPCEMWRVICEMFEPPSAWISKFTTESPTRTLVIRNGCSPSECASIASSISASEIASASE